MRRLSTGSDCEIVAGGVADLGILALMRTISLVGRMACKSFPRRITQAGLAIFGASFLVFVFVAMRVQYWEIVAAMVVGQFA